MSSISQESIQPVIFDYNDLISDKDLSPLIEKAFGKQSLGLCLVKNLPNYLSLRQNLLQLASKFANLPQNALDKVVHQESQYSFGWSHGKESMNGKLDLSKGSYYNNPIYDQPPKAQDKSYQEKYPHYGHDNIWPDQDLPELRDAFMTLGKYIVQVGQLVAKHCDQFLQKQENLDLPENFLLESAIEDSQTHKARLLHYFAMDAVPEASENIDSWCGLHVDHSLLTGLTSAMFVDEKQDPTFQEVDKSTPEMKRLLSDTGLFIQSRSDEYVRVAIPTDCLAFQLGEAAQLASHGWLRATPHLVRGMLGLSRNTFAVFMQPNVEYQLTREMNFSQFTEEVMKRHY